MSHTFDAALEAAIAAAEAELSHVVHEERRLRAALETLRAMRGGASTSERPIAVVQQELERGAKLKAPTLTPDTVPWRLLEYLADHPGPQRQGVLDRAIGRGATAAAARILIPAGYVHRPARGQYVITSRGRAAIGAGAASGAPQEDD